MFDIPPLKSTPLRDKMRSAYLQDETHLAKDLYGSSKLSQKQTEQVNAYAQTLVQDMRDGALYLKGVEGLMQEYSLSNSEGIALMCLAESLLRVPDSETANRLIEDKLGSGDFSSHIGEREQNWFVNASTWGLIITGKILTVEDSDLFSVLAKLIKRIGVPIIRTSINQMMKILGRQFVLGETIDSALSRAKSGEEKGYRYSYDMLGEEAKTAKDAQRYYEAYKAALHSIGKEQKHDMISGPGISIKISALHPRYEFMTYTRVMQELVPKVTQLCLQAKRYNLSLFIDAEEMERLELSLDIVETLLQKEELKGWHGLGIVVQAYSKRAPYVIDILADMAKSVGRKIMIRLVKGAYWDFEIKRAQEMGLSGYPVFTRKEHTDMSYSMCAKKLFAHKETVYPCFATHNARTVAEIIHIAGDKKFEFQKLHGMGDSLYEKVAEKSTLSSGSPIPCRIYAPVGQYCDLLPYLVRRLLENGANSSFVHRIYDKAIPTAQISMSARDIAKSHDFTPHPKICLPTAITLPERRFAKGIDFTDIATLTHINKQLAICTSPYKAFSLIKGKDIGGRKVEVFSPQNKQNLLGTVDLIAKKDLLLAVESTYTAYEKWNATPANTRAGILQKAADILEKQMPQFIALLTLEAGKTFQDAVAEVREAVDFLRYYGACASRLFSEPTQLFAVTGEKNTYQLHGRGVFLCISPWNFPLAIFIGQIAGALAAGNTVVAKPAEITPIVAYEAIKVLFEAGLPTDVLSLVLGEGRFVGENLLPDARIAGVAFTGSLETATYINRTLAGRGGGIVPLIAETGGQNAMLVDSSALLEQVTRDVLTGAFQSAGQRCSATRVIFLQKDIADAGIAMIKGAMEELQVADPLHISTDVGPVIDEKALQSLQEHVHYMKKNGTLLGITPLAENLQRQGHFFAPRLYEIDHLHIVKKEVFGPILHVVRWNAGNIDSVIDDINATGYGLTFSIHSRVNKTVEYVLSRMRVGNIYVNRNQIGALVGMQPFGGEGKSGTGCKAGGPNYLLRFASEKTISTDTTATGGNASLMAET